MAHPYYAVARGSRPGLYSSYLDAQEQLNDFPNPRYMKCMGRSSAIEFMERYGVERSDIRLFPRLFAETPDFKPQSYASFDDEFRRFASSQNLQRGHEMRKTKIDAIRDEIIYYYLSEGLMLHQVDETTGDVTLTEHQTVRIYQAMCKQSGKQPHDTLEGCLTELKCRPPYVNIIDFVNVFRTGRKVRTFHHWPDFCGYTRKHPIDLQYAEKSEFLRPLLQNLAKGPHTHLAQSWIRPFRRRGYADCGPGQTADTKVSDALPERPHLVEEESLGVETPTSPASAYSSYTIQSDLDPPPLSPLYWYTTPTPSPSWWPTSPPLPSPSPSAPLSPSPCTNRTSLSPSPTPQPRNPSLYRSLHQSQPSIQHKEITTLPFPNSAPVQNFSIEEFEDLLEDDEKISTQLSQQDTPPTVPFEEQVLDDLIQDDEEISTQLTQEWSRAEPEVDKVTAVKLGKRTRDMAPPSSPPLPPAKHRRVLRSIATRVTAGSAPS